jgi:hypothetical protein
LSWPDDLLNGTDDFPAVRIISGTGYTISGIVHCFLVLAQIILLPDRTFLDWDEQFPVRSDNLEDSTNDFLIAWMI